MRLSSRPTHQSISGRCRTRAYLREVKDALMKLRRSFPQNGVTSAAVFQTLGARFGSVQSQPMRPASAAQLAVTSMMARSARTKAAVAS
jgi:hypothetical protein